MITVESKISITIGNEKIVVSRTDAMSLYNALKRELGIADSSLTYPSGVRVPFQIGQQSPTSPHWERGTVTC